MTGQEVTVEYKGKVYNLCCEMCKKDFLKDPEAAIKKLEAADMAEPSEMEETEMK
ncbi:MAG: TRASH domain-containing protein [Candidatus Omnitrophica bacterium]|nr:TRASH domain-containing protein [Candidatus Omnitrophota bacterium]